MSTALLWPTVQTELRVRSRSTSTYVVLLAVLAISWLMLSDPAQGVALLVVDEARIRYSSAALAFGSATLGALLFSLAGFYLVRGHTQQDLRSGVWGLLAASPVSNASLLLARWFANTLFLAQLAFALLFSTWLLHALRGEGPWQPLVYLQTYALLFAPALLFTAAMALLFDAWGPLMGRRGDVAYFILWSLMLGVVPAGLSGHQGTEPPALLLLDSSGIGTSIHRLTLLLGSENFGVGGVDFNATLPLREFPESFWTPTLMQLRLASCALALLPLMLAWALFHRYDPSRVRARQAGAAAGRLGAWLQRLQQPLRRLLLPLLTLMARAPRAVAAPGAELLLSFITQPWALLVLTAAWVGAASAPASAHAGWLAGLMLAWGVLASELGARGATDSGHGAPDALPGGRASRLQSRATAAFSLGLLLLAPLLAQRPAWAWGLIGLLALLTILALALGQWTRGGRSFLALFLFGWFVAVQVGGPWLG
ncbi:MAG: hypothetical protein ACK5O3_04235 [Burkholderiales bacterium]|jgi:hypothetical protein